MTIVASKQNFDNPLAFSWNGELSRAGDTFNWKRLETQTPDSTAPPVPTECREHFRSSVERAVRNGRTEARSDFTVLLGGNSRQMRESVRLEEMSAGVWRASGMQMDVGDNIRIGLDPRKQAEDRLNHIISRAQCILWDAEVTEDAAGNLAWNTHVLSSESVQKWLGFDADGANMGEVWRKNIPEQMKQQMDTRCAEALRTGKSGFQQEFFFYGEDSKPRWMAEHVDITPLSAGRWNLVGVVIDISERKRVELELEQVNQKLLRLAREDDLTGLYNRRTILEKSAAEWSRWKRYGTSFSILIIDADDFKTINDRFGHDSGDLALRAISSRLREGLRNLDTVGRYGGEEFLVILPETDFQGALTTAHKLLDGISITPVRLHETDLRLTVSIGLACAEKSDTDFDSLLKRADTALYQAKSEGKNRVVVSAPPA